LAINRITIKDLKLEKLLIIFTAFTFSMGFISQILFFLAYFYLILSDSKNKIIMGAVAVFAIVGVYATKDTAYNDIYEGTIGRFEAMTQATEFMEGTSREYNAEMTKDTYKKNPIWGIGWDASKNSESLSDNAYETLAHDGIVGTIYTYFPYILLLLWAIRKRDKDLFGVVIFCALAIFHRPIHSNLLTYFMLFSMPIVYKYQEQSNKIQTNTK